MKKKIIVFSMLSLWGSLSLADDLSGYTPLYPIELGKFIRRKNIDKSEFESLSDYKDRISKIKFKNNRIVDPVYLTEMPLDIFNRSCEKKYNAEKEILQVKCSPLFSSGKTSKEYALEISTTDSKSLGKGVGYNEYFKIAKRISYYQDFVVRVYVGIKSMQTIEINSHLEKSMAPSIFKGIKIYLTYKIEPMLSTSYDVSEPTVEHPTSIRFDYVNVGTEFVDLIVYDSVGQKVISKYSELKNEADTVPPITSTQYRLPDYLVQRGDTVYSIARKFGVATPTLMKANDMTNPADLAPGQYLHIP